MIYDAAICRCTPGFVTERTNGCPVHDYDDDAICICDAYRADLRPGRCPIHSVSTVERNVMPTYTVVATLQSEDNEPITFPWSQDGTIADVMISVGQLIQHDLDDRSWTRTQTITITVNHGEA
jgi:hypothetical protein